MTISLNDLAILFAAGCFGGCINAIAVWGFGKIGIASRLKLQIAPEWSNGFLYSKIVWGGVWGFLFLLPFFSDSLLLRSLVGSLGPTLVVLLVVFPFQAKKGMLGLQLGTLTPLYAYFVNWLWSIATLLFIMNAVNLTA